MSEDLRVVLDKALHLPADDRATVITKLCESLEQADDSLTDEQWMEAARIELADRKQARESGEMGADSWEDVRARMTQWRKSAM
jgi:putative addiction module component